MTDLTPAIRQQLEQIASRTYAEADHRAARCLGALEEAYHLGQAEAREQCAQELDRLATDMEENAISKDADTWQRAHDEATRLREVATGLRGQEPSR